MMKRLTRSKKDKKIFGVCGGIAEYFEIDSTLVRIIWIISSFICGFGWLGFIAYLLCALVMPIQKEE